MPFTKINNESIQYAERPLEFQKGVLKFINPRRIGGFDKSAMKELKDSIQENGLLEPILVRQTNEIYQVVAGERRKRCIDKLIEENASVMDRSSGDMKPASEVYQSLECNLIDNCNDRLAIKLAFTENQASAPLSEADVVDFCEYLEDIASVERKEICDILGKSEAWLSQSLSFKKKLPAEAYECYRTGTIPRIVAIKLLGHEKDKRLDLLQVAINKAYERANEAVEEAGKAVETAQDGIEAEKAIKKLERARKNAEEVHVQESDLEDAAAETGEKHSSPKMLTSRQVKKFYIEALDASLVKVNENDDVIFGDIAINADYLRVSKKVLEQMLDGNRDIMKTLAYFGKAKND